MHALILLPLIALFVTMFIEESFSQCSPDFVNEIGDCLDSNGYYVETSQHDEPKDKRRVIPEALWDVHDVILDGTIIESYNITNAYDIKINHVFKGSIKLGLIHVDGTRIWNDFKKYDRALFYIYDISKVSFSYKYEVTEYSVKTTKDCDARSLIQISPILPNDPNQLTRGAPRIPANWHDPCVPTYFEYDPDFFNFREPIPPKMQQRHNIPLDLIRCYDDRVLVTKFGGSLACVEFKTKETLIHRGWAKGETSFAGKILEELRKGPQGITQEQNDYVKKIVLLDSRVQELINGREYDFNCCAYVSDHNRYPYHHTLSITINIRESNDQIVVGLDLDNVKISSISEGFQRGGGGLESFKPKQEPERTTPP